jgi:hypothetical protein
LLASLIFIDSCLHLWAVSSSLGARVWVDDPKELLRELIVFLGKIAERIPDWRKKVQEMIQMI